VAASYDVRARNATGHNWDPLRNVQNCVHELNVMHRFLLDQAATPSLAPGHAMIHVNYDRVFRDTEDAIDLFDRSGIADARALRSSITRFQANAASLLSRSRSFPEHVHAALEDGLDFTAAQNVAELTGVDVLAGLRA
jgi:hypothetical protein